MCSKTVNRIEINFKLFYFHSIHVVDRSGATALARNKPYGGNGDFV